MDQNKWQNLLDQMNTTGSSFRVKEGRTRLRLVTLPEFKDQDPPIFYKEVNSTYRGKMKTKYLIAALVLDGKGAKPEMATTVTNVIVPKTVIKGILTLLAEGYDLLDHAEGYGFSINRSGSGLDTDYSVIASKNPVPIKEGEIVMPTKNLDELAAEYTAWATRPRDNDGGNDEDYEDEDGGGEEAPRGRGGNRNGGGRRNPQRKEDW